MKRENNLYVYTHSDSAGTVFYVGKGTGQRAWSKDRDELWHRYVFGRLNGKYEVTIIRSGLTEDEALELEDDLMRKHKGETLLNVQLPLPKTVVTVDFARKLIQTHLDPPDNVTNWEEIERYHDIRRANETFVVATKQLEETDPEIAIARYKTAIIQMREQEKLSERLFRSTGLRGELYVPIRRGQPNLLDRLTLCLVKLGRLEEAAEETERYFLEFPDARESSRGKAVIKRINRGKKARR